MNTAHLVNRLNSPTDSAGLGVFRVLFGALGVYSSVRFIASGWVEAFFVKPDFHFKFLGAHWATVPSHTTLYVIFAVMAVSAFLVMLGILFRASLLVYILCFTYIELLDVTNYLNHYYLVSLLGLVLIFTPADAAYAVKGRPGCIGRWSYWLLRVQVAIVYFYAAAAKINTDWLQHGQPLGIWLNARMDIPLIGQYLQHPEVALAMSWSGFLYDATIVLWLIYARTRPVAYVAVVVFHAFTGLLFNIGMFPWIMIAATTIFFEPAWPRRWTPPISHKQGIQGGLTPRMLPLLVLWLSFQLAWPARGYLYEGPVNWHEQGMRFAWRVMVREKSGDTTFRVKHRDRSREELVPPARYLTSAQEREMSGQPDLILQLAHHIAADYRDRGHQDVQVRVDAWVSWNGRPPALLIEPSVNLATVQDSLAPAAWILPAPSTSPARLTPKPLERY